MILYLDLECAILVHKWKLRSRRKLISITHDSGSAEATGGGTSPHHWGGLLLNSLHLHHRRGPRHRLFLVHLGSIFLILPIFFLFLAVAVVLSDHLDASLGISHPLLDFLALVLNILFFEVDPFAQFIDIGDVLFGEEKFCEILEDGLGIFVIEPEYIGFGCFDVFGHPHCHGVLGIFLEPVSFSHDDLIVVESLLVFFLLALQFLLIVVDDFELFAEMVRYMTVLEHFRCFFFSSG